MTLKYDWGLYDGDLTLVTVGKGEVVTGPVKLAQKFTAVFLTEHGSRVYDEDYGTLFLTYLKNGAIRTDQDVVVYFNEAASAASFYLASQVDAATPADEILESVKLDHFELEPPYLFLYVELLTQAGTSRTIVLPASTMEVSES